MPGGLHNGECWLGLHALLMYSMLTPLGTPHVRNVRDLSHVRYPEILPLIMLSLPGCEVRYPCLWLGCCEAMQLGYVRNNGTRPNTTRPFL